MPTDPVCGMHVDEKTSVAHETFRGKTYYFCSSGCQQEFAREPSKYADRDPATAKERRK